MESPTVPADDDLTFTVRLHTRWSDEDNQAVLNNAVTLTLLEEGRYAYFQRLGLLDANQFPFVLGQTNVRFLAPGRGGVDVDLSMATTHLGNSSFRQAYRLRAVEDGTVWSEAEALLVAWDPATRGGRPMAPDFRAAIAAFEPLLGGPRDPGST